MIPRVRVNVEGRWMLACPRKAARRNTTNQRRASYKLHHHRDLNVHNLHALTMDPQSHLLSVLQSHKCSLGPDDVNWAFTNPKSSAPVTDYIEKYLGEDTLLSYEESAIITQLHKTGSYKKLLRAHPTPSTPPLLPSRLTHESRTLTTLATALQSQTAQLTRQKSILDSLRTHQRASSTRRRKLDMQRAKKWAAEKEELQAAIDDLVGILNEEATDLRATVMGEMLAEREEVREMLERDDRWIERLERLAEEFVMPEEGEMGWGEEVKEVVRLCETLVGLEGEVVRARLDRVFLEAVEEGVEGMVEGVGVEEVAAEIEGLHQEIPAVCRGAVFSEFLGPVVKREEREREKRGENWAVGGEYLQHILMYLTSRNDAITSHLSSLQSRDHAALTILASITAELSSISSPPPPQPTRTPSPTTPTTPTTPLPAPRLAPITPTTKRLQLSHRRRPSDLNSKHTNPPQSLLSLLGIALPAAPHIAQMAKKVNDAGWEMAVLEEVEAKMWADMVREKGRVEGEMRWPVTRREAVEGGGAMVRIAEEVRREGEEVERGVMVVARGVQRVVREVEKVGGERGKREFVERWGR
ncbi:hypothetical protein EX30DRAFT_67975 [Ascodesmis nigricans]|uniref:Uncharacterized protein n=1 Tax=Ascodesmis nigricans TaxID=341454 RepID=A0A4S2MU15_9PEZI|nr:hypothetical protein EX30DRAFT_67975 [Ascodesmis nigricans]